MRKAVARRGLATENRNAIRDAVYFMQWCHWRTRDPEADAIRGSHDRNQPPLFDLLTELGKLRRKLRDRPGDTCLAQENWVHGLSEEKLLEELPTPHLGNRRITGKTPRSVPVLGARVRTKPADWPRGPQSKGVVMQSTKRRTQGTDAEGSRKRK